MKRTRTAAVLAAALTGVLASSTPALATTTITSTKVCNDGAAVAVDDFTESITGTIFKADAVQCVGITATRGTVRGAYRVVDQTSDLGHLGQLTVKQVDADNLRRGGVRVRNTDHVDISDVRFVGDPSATDRGDVPDGIATSDIMTGDVAVERAVLNSWVGTAGTSYTNGDGGAIEEQVTSTWRDITASFNQDGLDLKGNATVERLLGEGDYRTFRGWGHPVVSDITSVNARNASVWVGGGTRFTGGSITRLTVIEQPGATAPDIKVDSSAGPDVGSVDLVVIDPVTPGNRPLRIQDEPGNHVNVVVKYTQPGGVVATRPAPPNLTGTVTPPPPATSPSSVGTAGFAYAGTWNTVASPEERWSNTAGDTASTEATIASGGGTVTLRAVRDLWQGVAGISIDGGPEVTADQYSDPRQADASYWTSPQLAAGAHTIRVRVTGQPHPGGLDDVVSVTGASTTNGTLAAPAAATPPPAGTAPAGPTNVTAVVNPDKSVTVSGTVAAGTTSVNVFETVHADSNVPRTPAPTITGNTFTWTSTPRTAGASYKYQVQDCNAAGCSTRVVTSPSTVTIPV